MAEPSVPYPIIEPSRTEVTGTQEAPPLSQKKGRAEDASDNIESGQDDQIAVDLPSHRDDPPSGRNGAQDSAFGAKHKIDSSRQRLEQGDKAINGREVRDPQRGRTKHAQKTTRRNQSLYGGKNGRLIGTRDASAFRK